MTNPEERLRAEDRQRSSPIQRCREGNPSYLFIVSDLTAHTVATSRELPEIKMIPEINVDPPNIKIIFKRVLIGGEFHLKLQLTRLGNAAAVTRDALSRSSGSHPAAKSPACFHKLPSTPWVCLSQQLGWKAAAAPHPPSQQTAHDSLFLARSVSPSCLIFSRGFNHNASRLINDRYEQQLLHANSAGFFI